MRRLFSGTCLLVSILLVSGAAVTGQDKKDAPKAKGTLPANFGKLGLSEEQKAKIHAISADYKSKLAAIKAQEDELKAKQRKEFESVLTETQVEQLRKLQTGDTGDKKPEAPKPANGEKKPTDK
jgi:hypothetical protein